MSWLLIIIGLALLAFALYLIFDLWLWATVDDYELFVLRVKRWLGGVTE